MSGLEIQRLSARDAFIEMWETYDCRYPPDPDCTLCGGAGFRVGVSPCSCRDAS